MRKPIVFFLIVFLFPMLAFSQVKELAVNAERAALFYQPKAGSPVGPPVVLPAAKPEKEKEAVKRKRFSIHLSVNKGFATQSEAVSWSRQVYYENATYGVSYGATERNSFSASFGYMFWPAVGVEIGGDFATRGLASDYNASIPHPLVFGAPRAAEGKASYQIGENSFFMNLVLSFPLSRFGVDLFAGPVYIKVNGDVIKDIQYSQSYPYGSITIIALNEKASQNVMAFNAGARLIFNFSRSVGIFVSGTYLSGTAELKPADVPGLKLSLGGFKAGGGLAVSF